MQRRAATGLWTGTRRTMLLALGVALPAAAVVGWGSPTGQSWITAVLLPLAVFALGRMGTAAFRADGAHLDPAPAREARSAAPRGEEGAVARAAPPRVPTTVALERERVLEALRAGLDEVRYAPGSPNVLSMTKWLDRGGEEPGAAEHAAASASGTGLSCSRADQGDEAVLAVAGALDATTAAGIATAFDALASEGRTRVTLDLSSLHFLDGSGAASLVRLGKRCHELGRTVRVSGAKDQPLAVFKVLRLERLFELA